MVMDSKRKKILSYFRDNATTHGISAIHNAKTAFVKTFIVVIVLFLLAFMGWCIIQTLRQFYNFEIYTSIEIETNHRLKFPAITICQNNFIAKSDLNSSLMEEVQNKTNEVKLGKVPFDKINEFLSNLTYDITAKLLRSKKGIPRQPSFIMEDIYDSCLFAQEQRCNLTRDFEPTFSLATTWKCYTFNSKPPLYTQSGQGYYHGLRMVLFLNQSDQLPLIGKEYDTGFTIYIHEQDTVPFMGIDGILVGPSFHTKIAMKKREVIAMASPFPSKCTNGEGVLNYLPGAYSSLACQMSCVFDAVRSKCGYTIPFMRIHNASIKLVPPTTSMLKCKDRIIKQVFRGRSLPCSCPRACKEVHYEPTISQSKWPLESELPFYSAISKNTFENGIDNVSDELIAKSFLKLDIYFDDMSVRKYVEKQLIGPFDLLSNIGGHLGLWSGSSIFSIFEWAVALGSLLLLLAEAVANKLFCHKENSKTRAEEIDKHSPAQET